MTPNFLLVYIIMTIYNKFLDILKSNVGNWTCSYCAIKSTQPAKVFNDIKAQGYVFEKSTRNNWGKSMYCPCCGRKTTHYKLLDTTPVIEESNERINITSSDKERILHVLGSIDAMSGKTTTNPTIDHKVPIMRFKGDIDVASLSDDEIENHFQILSYTNNLVKSNACKQCVVKNTRQSLFGINYFTKGDEVYNGTCEGCGYHDCVKWRESVNKILNPNEHKKSLPKFKSFKEYSNHLRHTK